MSYTPGPWLHGDTHVFALDATGNINRLYVLVQGGFLDRDSMEHTPDAEMLATTRLIASAPELLEAMEGVLEGLPFGPGMTEYELVQAGCDPTEARRLHAAYAAIAKAKGQ